MIAGLAALLTGIYVYINVFEGLEPKLVTWVRAPVPRGLSALALMPVKAKQAEVRVLRRCMIGLKDRKGEFGIMERDWNARRWCS